MRKILFSQLTWDDLAALVKLDERGIRAEPWAEFARGDLDESSLRFVERVSAGLGRFSPSLANEATVWSRAIFPLLFLAESDRIVAQAEVPLSARLGDVELSGTADGAFGTPISGELRAPFLIVVEAKRGLEGYNPVAQLYGELLAAAVLNAREDGRPEQRIFGCYTVGDNWTLVQADVAGIHGGTDAQPSMTIVASAEMNEKAEATRILRILRSIVSRHVAAAPPENN